MHAKLGVLSVAPFANSAFAYINAETAEENAEMAEN